MLFQPKTMLVTGAAGFIGCNFVRLMLEKHQDLRVISYDALTYAGSRSNLFDVMDHARHVFIHADIGDRTALAEALRTHCVDTVVHFAAESHVDNSIASPEVFFQANVMGTLSLIDEARKYWQDEMGWDESQCRFHHVSTDEVYGALGKDDPAFTEESSYKPNSPYSASKAGSDHVVRSYFHTYKIPVTISNCSNNYGPYQHEEKFIPVVIKACTEQKPIPIYGDGSNIRDWLHVDDHCSAIDLIIQEGKVGEVYNVGGDNELSNLDLVKKICEMMDEICPGNKPHEKLIQFVEDRKGHDWRYAINHGKLQEDLGWVLEKDSAKNWDKTIDFYVESKKFKRSLKLVPVSEEHYEFIRKLRMDERTQSSFIEKADITEADQRDYMARHSKDYYICLSGNQALGYAGVIDSDIRICTDPEHQGKGVGSFMLAQIKKMYPHAVGRIKKSNLASQKIFQKSEVYFNLID